ncbi:MAG: arginine--tRNA ligase, partial [Pirellulales bacterium]|nr:arginine--tRNA ligase [Pirellulales bacterium]
MNILSTIRARFRPALESVDAGEIEKYLEMIKPSQDPQFGDYQANCAMPLGKQLGESPREVASRIVAALDLQNMCHQIEIAGPGFINLTLRQDFLADQIAAALEDERIGIFQCDVSRSYVIDFSAPNVAKPMHVGHIRSTVIGDALAKILRFCGHSVITDNHIGDWGTQFGMILYGYKHFLNAESYATEPVTELARLYRLVNQLVQYRTDLKNIPQMEQKRDALRDSSANLRTPQGGTQKEDKSTKKELRRLEAQIRQIDEDLNLAGQRVAAIENDTALASLAEKHADVDRDILRETAQLHGSDETNVSLWKQFIPVCLEDIEKIYRRLGIAFDHILGESFYQDRLADTVTGLRQKGLATESDGAICVFSDVHDVPMIIQKKDGAFLYATTDLATIDYRLKTFHPDVILYVVDHRQSLHFEQLFDAVIRSGCEQVELCHVKFGTVLGEDGRPFKTRSGSTVGLGGLLDEAIRRAGQVVRENNPQLCESECESIADTVGIGALKYADLSQNRESDYVFSYDKMLALNGNTATYMQYAYARIQSILSKGNANIDALLK